MTFSQPVVAGQGCPCLTEVDHDDGGLSPAESEQLREEVLSTYQQMHALCCIRRGAPTFHNKQVQQYLAVSEQFVTWNCSLALNCNCKSTTMSCHTPSLRLAIRRLPTTPPVLQPQPQPQLRATCSVKNQVKKLLGARKKMPRPKQEMHTFRSSLDEVVDD